MQTDHEAKRADFSARFRSFQRKLGTTFYTAQWSLCRARHKRQRRPLSFNFLIAESPHSSRLGGSLLLLTPPPTCDLDVRFLLAALSLCRYLGRTSDRSIKRVSYRR